MKNYLSGVFWGPRNPEIFRDGIQQALSELPPHGIFTGDNLVTFGRNLSFLDDEKFMSAFNRNAGTDVEKAVIWRSYVLCWAARRALRLEGDLVECGCYKGVSARVIVDYLGFRRIDRRFYLYDLFEHSAEMTHHAMPEHSRDLYPAVCRRFEDVPNVKVIKGPVPESFSQGTPEKIAFLHIDMNNAAAEIGALEALFERVAPGAVVVFDDYGWTGYVGQKLAEDRFFAERDYQILELPTGQGLLIV